MAVGCGLENVGQLEWLIAWRVWIEAVGRQRRETLFSPCWISRGAEEEAAAGSFMLRTEQQGWRWARRHRAPGARAIRGLTKRLGAGQPAAKPLAARTTTACPAIQRCDLSSLSSPILLSSRHDEQLPAPQCSPPGAINCPNSPAIAGTANSCFPPSEYCAPTASRGPTSRASRCASSWPRPASLATTRGRGRASLPSFLSPLPLRPG